MCFMKFHCRGVENAYLIYLRLVAIGCMVWLYVVVIIHVDKLLLIVIAS